MQPLIHYFKVVFNPGLGVLLFALRTVAAGLLTLYLAFIFDTAGSALLALVDSDSFYVSGYFEETKLPRIEEGSRVRIQLMSGETFGGVVQSIAFAISDR